MKRTQEDYEQITFEPEQASIHKRDASITTTEAAVTMTTTLSSVESDNNNQIDSLSTTTTAATAPSSSVEKYPYSASNHPEADLVSITTSNPPAAAAQFSPSQIDYLHHRPIAPFCYELNGNLRYVSNKFQPQGVWSSVHYYYNDPYSTSLVGQYS